MASLHPASGARLVLELDALQHDGPVRYRASVYEPGDVLHETLAELTDEGVRFEAWSSTVPGGAAPAWAVTFLERLLLGLPKKHAADASWPPKITRWRAP